MPARGRVCWQAKPGNSPALQVQVQPIERLELVQNDSCMRGTVRLRTRQFGTPTPPCNKHSAVETKDGQQGRQAQSHVRGHGVPDEACPGPKWDGGWKINFLQAELYRQWSHQG